MIRLTLILAAVIFAILVVVPGRKTDGEGPSVGADAAASGADRPARALTGDSALQETRDGRLVLLTPEGEELAIALVIEPSELTAEDARVNLPPAETSGALDPVLDDDGLAGDGESEPQATGGETAVAETAPAALPPADGIERLRVAGDRVNFRAGPSTTDAILGALDRGTELELVERVADGWARLRLPNGLEGFMSEDFLEPAN
ncbi:SH3 domain-containing protein [Roseibacterium sp. SDUM158016]|uniref:SH3 domain-containing protein n=1 Tax=Roseicyclus sediminis TaxID=2980997 RepID=UPI0021D0D586|nr:SH3 domain-containing protein [Roseibacterium sp. SDUM158016]MCU4655063.1 SH3 domain-containing protein [Roseibacterium sp. SDUM158016]